MSANLEGKCPHCGSPKHGTLTTHWQDAYQCWTVYPHDGPHRRGAICIELCKGQEATKAVNEWIDKTDWVQRNEAGLFDNMLGWHRADCMRTAIDRLRAQFAALQAVPQGVEVPELTADVVEELHQKSKGHRNPGYALAFEMYRWVKAHARLVPTPPQPLQSVPHGVELTEDDVRRALMSNAIDVDVEGVTPRLNRIIVSRLVPTTIKPLQPEERRMGPDEVVVDRNYLADLEESVIDTVERLQNDRLMCESCGNDESLHDLDVMTMNLLPMIPRIEESRTSAQDHNGEESK